MGLFLCCDISSGFKNSDSRCLREHLVLESATTRHIHYVVALEDPIIISRRRPLLKWDNITGPKKAKRRHTQGTGRMRHLKLVNRRFHNGFREGTTAKPRQQKSQAK